MNIDFESESDEEQALRVVKANEESIDANGDIEFLIHPKPTGANIVFGQHFLAGNHPIQGKECTNCHRSVVYCNTTENALHITQHCFKGTCTWFFKFIFGRMNVDCIATKIIGDVNVIVNSGLEKIALDFNLFIKSRSDILRYS